jgi:Recombination directionality factor-like
MRDLSRAANRTAAISPTGKPRTLSLGAVEAPQLDEPADLVGTFHLSSAHHPHSATGWRMTTPDRRIARHVAELLGGTLMLTGEPGPIEVVVAASEFRILLAGSRAVCLSWHRGSAPPVCNGTVGAARPCTCPTSFAERRRAARGGAGCEPHLRVRFRLEGAAALGAFTFVSGNWTFAEEVATAAGVLCCRKGLTPAMLRCDVATVTLSSGQVVRCSRPALTIIRAR